MKRKLLSLYCIFALSNIFAASLSVNNPYSTSWQAQTQGVIDSVAFDIYPIGLVTKFEMTIAFSAPKNYYYFKETDTFEVKYNFELPSQTIVSDAWLWMDGKAKSAQILEKGTAKNTYETVVHRVKRDPLILYKNTSYYYYDYYYSNNSLDYYEAAIFPMKMNETRCMKVSCLIPAQNFDIKTLINNIMVSSNKVNLKLRVHQNKNTNVQLLNYETYSSQLQTPNKSIDSVSFASYNKDKNQYFAIGFSPLNVLGIPKLPRKKIIVIDSLLAQNADIAKSLSQYFTHNENTKDSVLFITSTNQDFTWLPVNSNTISTASFVLNNLNRSQSFESLLYKAFEIQKAQNEKCQVILLSSIFRTYYTYGSDYYYVNYNTDSSQIKRVNLLLEQCKNNGIAPHDLYVLDLDNPNNLSSYNYYYNYNSSYPSNSFLKTLSNKISGLLFFTNYSSIMDKLQEVDKETAQVIEFLNCRIDANKGILFAQYANANNPSNISNPDYHIEVGQGRGVDSIILQVSGIWNDSLYMKRLKYGIKKSSDSIAKNIWAGVYLQNREKIETQTTTIEKEIIANSIEYHILSRYTAFLSLEEGIEIIPCENCSNDDNNNGGWRLVTEFEVQNQSKINVYPNPFNNVINIEIIDLENIEFIELYSVSGEMVMRIEKSNINSITEIDTKQLSSGIYYLKISYNNKIEHIKVVKQ